MIDFLDRGRVLTTSQAWWDKKYFKRTRNYIDLANKIIPLVEKHLNITGTTVVVSYIKSKYITGDYTRATCRVRIDPRQSRGKFIDTLIHELVHADQYNNGHLNQFLDKDGMHKFTWKKAKPTTLPYSHQKYLDLPWEIDARRRAKSIMKLIAADLNS